MAQIQDKDTYAELTSKQQAVVDELVNDPMAQNTVIADRANVSRSTVSNVKEHYPHIVETKLNEGGRYDGEETTEGDPFSGKLTEHEGWQAISDRPAQEAGAPDKDEMTITVELAQRDIEAMLTTQRVPGNITKQLLAEVLVEAFGENQ